MRSPSTPTLTLLLLASATACAAAAAADPLASAECRAAIAQLDAQESAPAASAAASAASAALQAARREVARVCLGTTPDPETPPPAPLTPSPPQLSPLIPPITAPAASRVRPPPQTRPPVERESPPGLGACDATGCFDSRGRRLQRVGPQLLGPAGLCSEQGGVLVCPR